MFHCWPTIPSLNKFEAVPFHLEIWFQFTGLTHFSFANIGQYFPKFESAERSTRSASLVENVWPANSFANRNEQFKKTVSKLQIQSHHCCPIWRIVSFKGMKLWLRFVRSQEPAIPLSLVLLPQLRPVNRMMQSANASSGTSQTVCSCCSYCTRYAACVNYSHVTRKQMAAKWSLFERFSIGSIEFQRKRKKSPDPVQPGESLSSSAFRAKSLRICSSETSSQSQ